MRIKILIALLVLKSFSQEISLTQAYELALSNNNNLKKEMFETLATNERVTQATSLLLPKINGEISKNIEKYRRPSSSVRIDESYNRKGVTLTQSIFKPSLWYERSQEKLKSEGSVISLENTKQNLAKDVAQAYFNYIYAKQALELAKSYEASSKIKYEQVLKSLKLGLANKMDMLEAKVRYDEAMLGVNKAKREIEITKLSLARLVGADVEVNQNFNNINIDFFKNLDLNKFYSVKDNLLFKQSIIGVEITEKEYKKAFSEHLPSFDVSFGYYDHEYSNEMFNDEKNRIEGYLRFTMPIFSGGLTMARTEEARLLNLAKIEEQKELEKEIALSQKKAASDLLSYVDEYQITNEAIEHAELFELSIERGYEEGLKNLADLLDARARLFKTKNEALNATHNLIMSYLELKSLVGDISTSTFKDLEQVIR